MKRCTICNSSFTPFKKFPVLRRLSTAGLVFSKEKGTRVSFWIFILLCQKVSVIVTLLKGIGVNFSVFSGCWQAQNRLNKEAKTKFVLFIEWIQLIIWNVNNCFIWEITISRHFILLQISHFYFIHESDSIKKRFYILFF